jgi:uncharacterized membrane protein
MFPRVAAIPRDPDRLVLFTDAVVAIAITLLVLPLVEGVTEHKEHASELITEHWPQMWSFVLSFAVISRLWLTHHRMFEHVKAYNRPLMTANNVWLLTVVFLPFPTGMIGTYGTDHFTTTFYVASVLASSLCQTILIVIIFRTPALQSDENPATPTNVANAISATGLLVVALLLTALVPAVNYLSLLLLLLSPLVVALWKRLRPATRQS